MYQTRVELGGYAGDFDYALTSLDRSCRAGLVDINWLDYCPVLDPLGDEPTFEQVVETVERRLADIRSDGTDT